MTTSTPSVVDRINELHKLIQAPDKNRLHYAIACGELLIEQRKVVKESGQTFSDWVAHNLDMFVTTAYKYIRLAEHKEEVLKGNYSGIDPAIEAIGTDRRLSQEAKAEMLRLYNNGKGKTLEEIADMFGLKKSTVWYWVSSKSRDRIKRLQREQRVRAARALQREEESKLAKSLKDEVGEAYSLIRKAEQVLDKKIAEQIPGEQRLHLLEALAKLYEAEDEIVKAIKASNE